MNAEWKAKWLVALRSGEYKQARSVLASHEGFCCLGVLAHIQGCPIELMFNRQESVTPTVYGAGLDFGDMYRLARMNDNGKTFSEIADEIEATV